MLLQKLLLVLALAGSSAPHPSVTAIDIVGRVTDPRGQPLQDVQVVIVEIGRSTVTDVGGRFTFTAVPTGAYSISFTLVGFSPQVRRLITTRDREEMVVILKPTVVELPPIQVTATPGATDPLRSPQPASVLTGEELNISDHSTLGATIDGLAGVHNWSTGSGIGKPVIRGLSGNRVLVASGGRRVEHQGWGDEHSPNVETVAAERIEVVRGPASVLYGSDAIGGVVNVVPRELPDALDRRGFVGGRIGAAYSTNPREPEGSLLLEGASGSFGFRATASGRTSDQVRTPAGPLANSGNEAFNLGGAVGARGNWGSAQLGYERRRSRPQIHEDPASDPGATPYQDVASDQVNATVRLPWGYSRFELYGGWSENDRSEFEAREAPGATLRLRERNATGGMKFQHAPIGSFVGTLGLSYRRDQLRESGEETLVPSSNADNVGLFIFEQAELGPVVLGAGARYQYRSLDVFDNPSLGVQAQTRSYNSLSGNLGASFLAAEGVSLVANVGSGFRAPSTFELFANGEHEGTNRFEIGDPSLGNERSLNLDLALRVVTENLQWEFGAFANLVDNYIFPDPTSQIDSATGLQVFLITQGDARLLGAETSLVWHVNDRLHLSGTADFVHAQNTTLNQPLPFIPPLRASYWVQYDLGREGATWSHPYLAIGGESNARQTRLDPDDFAPDGYTLVHLKAGLTLAPANGGVDIDIVLNNALNKRYTNFMSRYKTYALDMGRNLVIRAATAF